MRWWAHKRAAGTATGAVGWILFALASAWTSPASADWKAFLPSPYENHAFFETYGSYERDNSTGSANTIDWNDTFLRERLTLQSVGYSYNPRFIQYQFSLAGLTKQENYQASYQDGSDWTYASSIEYSAHLYVLPEHPYNAHAFAMRYEPLFRQQAARQHDSVANTYGVKLRYRQKPYFLNTSFVDTTIDSSGSSSNVKRLGVDGEYFKRFKQGYELAFTGQANPSWYSNSDNLDGTDQEYSLGNFINLKKVRLNSTVSQTYSDQHQDPGQKYNTDQFTAWELMSAYWPWNFRTDFTYRHHDNTSDVESPDVDTDRHYSDQGDRVELDVVHKLYQSLDTIYRISNDWRDSSGGESTVLAHNLALNYRKNIPRGTMWSGFNFGRADTDNQGFADVVKEPYKGTQVPGTFALRQQNVDPDSIDVFVTAPFPPFDTVLLQEGIHYDINTGVDPFEIRVFALPPDFVVPGTYDIFVNYSLQSGDYELRTDSYGANLSFQLFSDMVSPYFRYSSIRSDVLSGDFPGTPTDSDLYTAGLLLQYGPLRARGEYATLDWDVNPQDTWRAELQYVGTLTRTINAYGITSYVNRHYKGGQATYNNLEYTEEDVAVSASLTKRLPAENLFLSLGGSYTHMTGLVETNSWSANSSLVWTIGKLDITLGVTAYGADTSGDVGVSTERNREFVYLNLRRQLL